MEIVYNADWGLFGISDAACKRLGIDPDDYSSRYLVTRHDSALVAMVKESSVLTSAKGSKLCIATIPDGSHYIITDYDGMESVYYSASPIERAI